MNKVIRISAVLLISISCTGCLMTSFLVEGGLKEGRDEASASSEQETIHGSLYGFEWSERTRKKSQDSGLYKVEVSTNGLYLIASLISLGFYVPQDVQWWLVKEKPKAPTNPYVPAKTKTQSESSRNESSN